VPLEASWSGDLPIVVQWIALPVTLACIFAIVAQIFTVPLAAAALIRVWRRGPGPSRPVAVGLFGVCLAGISVYVVFAAFI